MKGSNKIRKNGIFGDALRVSKRHYVLLIGLAKNKKFYCPTDVARVWGNRNSLMLLVEG